VVEYSFRQKSNMIHVSGENGTHAQTIYTGRSTKFIAYLVHYEVSQVPSKPPAIVKMNESRIPEACKTTMLRVSYSSLNESRQKYKGRRE
jgi:hypothetical protein